MAMESINPATGETIRRYDTLTPEALQEKLDRAHEAFLEWRGRSFDERAAVVGGAAEVLRARKPELARLVVAEMGKILSEAEGEVEKSAWGCEFYAEHAEAFLRPEETGTDASKSFVTYTPLGVILAVMPWNFPLWQAFRFAAPALMAGNAGVLKHASSVPGSALAIEEIFRAAGVPEGVFQTLLIGSGDVASVLEHPKVRGVALTGSTPAGRAVAAKAGSLLMPSVMELGGSDPYVVLADADLDQAVDVCVTARMLNCGQSCIAAKRFIVVDSVREAFAEKFVERMTRLTMGSGLDAGVDYGPMASVSLRDELHEQVEKSVSMGARVALGGEIPQGPGAFYPATVLTGVRPGMPAHDEELFGPVAPIIAAADEEEALRIANETEFGLGAAVFTRDVARGERIAAEVLEAGSCFVNGQVKSDPRLPFGGIKESGYGRELSHEGIKEFVNTKTVWVR